MVFGRKIDTCLSRQEQLLAVLADRREWDRLVKSHFIYWSSEKFTNFNMPSMANLRQDLCTEWITREKEGIEKWETETISISKNIFCKFLHELIKLNNANTNLLSVIPVVYYAPINVNPVGGECGQGVGIWQILKFFDQIP